MRPETYGPQTLESLLKRKKVATLPEMKKALGTTSPSTVVRKLNTLGYLSSYSHRGKFYTLGDAERWVDAQRAFERALEIDRPDEGR